MGVQLRGAAGTVNADVFALWVYLAGTPLLWLTITILAYCLRDHRDRSDVSGRPWAGTFTGIAIGLNALVTAIVLQLLS